MSEKIKYFAKPATIYPKAVYRGRYRDLKWISTFFLLAIYYIAPYLRYERGGDAPNQAILIDLPARRGYFFSIEIWSHEVYYLAAIFVLAAIGLFFVSSLLGRVWCGYACPQTVWTDLFIWVERIIQGDRNARMRLDKSPLSFEKIWKKALTHIIWLFIGLATGGAWVMYFNDAPTLWHDLVRFQASWNVTLWIVALTLSTYVMAGFAREQVCAYMCPYARFQSAMFDKDTLIISYDADRGEPRGKHKAGDSWEGKGSCIDCGNCVAVCPTGIDIRDGLQMECIACGLCIDACNDVMDKVGLPRGLIRYDTETNSNNRIAAKANKVAFSDKFRILRPRTFYYITIMTVFSSIVLYSLMTRSSFNLHVIHDRNPVFVRMSDGSIRNNYTIKIMNMRHVESSYSLSVEGLASYDIKLVGAGNPKPEDLLIPADNIGEFRVMLSNKGELKAANQDITFKIKDNISGAVFSHKSVFVQGK